eukprot:gb/GFBE01053294.1/.p1 GENE.gb/GFBE01053294.1/~~gb/GFBE01053294.1/.p1  ORF type:complete len:508 (+),score=101.15 gb/GFBE01053294.1/:1-1524(+)
MSPPRVNGHRTFTRDIEFWTARGLSPIQQDDGKSVSQFINEFGLGLYQVQWFILCSGFIISEAALLSVVSGVAADVSAELGTSSTLGKSGVMTCAFTGLMCGAILAGSMADSLGRRAPLFLGYAGLICTAAMLAIHHSALVLYALLFILGCCAGTGVPVAFIILSEVSPKAFRGMCTGAMAVSWCLGELWAGVGLWYIMPQLEQGPWRMAIVWATAPSVVMMLFGSLSRVARFDTAQWLSVKGRRDDVFMAVNLMAEMNGKELLSSRQSLRMEDTPKGDAGFMEAVNTLQETPMRLHTLVLAVLFFGKDFTGYGMGVFWPLAWEHVHEMNFSPATELCATALLGIPGVCIAMLLMHLLPRRVALATAAGACAAAVACLLRLESGSPLGLVGVALFKLFFPTWQMVMMLLPSEIFPTRIKGVAYSCVAVCGRSATVIAPASVSESRQEFLSVCCAIALLTTFLARSLPETKDAGLAGHSDDHTAAKRNEKKIASYGAAHMLKQVQVVS